MCSPRAEKKYTVRSIQNDRIEKLIITIITTYIRN